MRTEAEALSVVQRRSRRENKEGWTVSTPPPPPRVGSPVLRNLTWLLSDTRNAPFTVTVTLGQIKNVNKTSFIVVLVPTDYSMCVCVVYVHACVHTCSCVCVSVCVCICVRVVEHCLVIYLGRKVTRWRPLLITWDTTIAWFIPHSPPRLL